MTDKPLFDGSPEFMGDGAMGHTRVHGVCGKSGRIVLQSFTPADPDDDAQDYEEDTTQFISIDHKSLDDLLAFVRHAISIRDKKVPQ